MSDVNVVGEVIKAARMLRAAINVHHRAKGDVPVSIMHASLCLGNRLDELDQVLADMTQGVIVKVWGEK